MPDNLDEIIEKIRGNSILFGNNEQATKQGAILPILARLGWDRDDVNQVVPEYAVRTGRVDYCLRLHERARVFVEAKRGIEDLGIHQEQLLDYAFKEGVEIAVLTNGLTWWLYLPTESGSWEQRKFFTIDLSRQDTITAANHFRQFLSLEAIKSGEGVRAAKEIHKNRAKHQVIKETLPKAWRELVDEPDELLLDLLIEKVESVCGFRPEPEVATQFLKLYSKQPYDNHKDILQDNITIQDHTTDTRTSVSRIKLHNSNETRFTGDFTNQRPRQYSFNGEVEIVHDFKQILLGLLTKILNDKPKEFERVLELTGRRKRPFSRNSSDLIYPAMIGNTGVFVETCRNANSSIKLCHTLVSLFGYPPNSFTFELQSGEKS